MSANKSSHDPRIKVAVVGAGVIGLSAALHLTERLPNLLDLTIISDRFAPDITSDKAGAIIKLTSMDASLSENYQQNVMRWSQDTFSRVCDIYRSVVNREIQFTLRTGYELLYEDTSDPWWRDDVIGFRHVDLRSKEASIMNISPECKQIWCFSTFIVDPTLYLQWMQKQFVSHGGRIEKRKINSLEELSVSGYNIIINCTGMGASHLVQEKNMKPVRGQTVIAYAPFVSHFILDFKPEGEISYIFPRSTDLVMGGIKEYGNCSEEIDDCTTEAILSRCTKLQPSLLSAKVIKSKVGLRPTRSQVRLDAAVGVTGGLVIHCYGHGDLGITMSWGCAKDIGDIVQTQVKKINGQGC